MNKIVDYMVMGEEFLGDMEKRVTLILHAWQPLGGVFCEQGLWYQVMVKYESDTVSEEEK